MGKGLEKWQELYRRARTMSATELAERLRQQALVRLDSFRHSAGIGFEPRRLGASPQPQARFFFSSADIPRLCVLLRRQFPEEADKIIRRAERICEHRFDLLGYQDLDYGTPIDWHADRVHGKRAPRKPWFKIHYLDFAEVGDSKVIWELNRHQHLVTLAKAYRLSGGDNFAGELFRQWKHWHSENPYPIGINWASSLEVAFRVFSWLWVYLLMAGSPAMPTGFRSELLRKLAVSGRHIECYLSTYFSPNTHLLGEAAALFFIGTMCPELQQARRWQEHGWAILQHEARRQVRDDGFHFEQSTYYHVYALDFFLHCAVLASRNELTIPPQFERTLERMLQVLSILGRAGSIPRLGDDDGGRLFDPQRNQAEHLLDPLATGAILFGRGDFKSVAGAPREETLWLLGEAGMAEFDRLPAASPEAKSTELLNTGLYVMAGNDPQRQLVIDAGPQGADKAGHGHADALSITVSSNGLPLLIDSGTFEYVGPDSQRNRFRGTRAHNTMTVDGLDQSEPKGPFSWASLPNVRAESWIKGETFDFFVASQDGYMRLAEPVLHRRFVFSRKSHFWLVRDQALGRGRHQLDLFWHVNPELSPVEQNTNAFQSARAGLRILAPGNGTWSHEILIDDWSPAYGQKQRHAVVHLGVLADLPAEFATLLLAANTMEPAIEEFTPASSPWASESAVGYRFQTSGERHYVIFGMRKPWKLSPWSSDADFLYWSESRDGDNRTLIFCNGSYVEAGSRQLISSRQTLSRCEALLVNGELRVIASEPNAAIDEHAFKSIAPAQEISSRDGQD